MMYNKIPFSFRETVPFYNNLTQDYERDMDNQGIFLCRRLVKSRIVQGIHLFDMLLWPVGYTFLWDKTTVKICANLTKY